MWQNLAEQVAEEFAQPEGAAFGLVGVRVRRRGLYSPRACKQCKVIFDPAKWREYFCSKKCCQGWHNAQRDHKADYLKCKLKMNLRRAERALVRAKKRLEEARRALAAGN